MEQKDVADAISRIDAYLNWQAQAQQEYQRALQEQALQQQILQGYQQAAARRMQTDPNFAQTYSRWIDSRYRELKASGLDDNAAQQALVGEEFLTAARALQSGGDPAESIMKIAESRGLTAPTEPEPEGDHVNGNGKVNGDAESLDLDRLSMLDDEQFDEEWNAREQEQKREARREALRESGDPAVREYLAQHPEQDARADFALGEATDDDLDMLMSELWPESDGGELADDPAGHMNDFVSSFADSGDDE
jgi:hypothetical protein